MKKTDSDAKFPVMIFFLLFVFLLEFYGFAWSRTRHRETGYSITTQTSEYKSLIAQQKKLKIEIALLKSPKRIERIAKNRMGLTTPGQNQILTIR